MKTHGSVRIGRGAKGMLAVILVPENANWTTLMDLYGDIAIDIRQWRASIDKPSQGNDDGKKGSETTYVSIYADPARDEMLKSFDNEAGTLKSALADARYVRRIRTLIQGPLLILSIRKNGDASFLTYGYRRGHIGGLEWNVLDKKGWGIIMIIDKQENWRYIGEVRHSRSHGSGVVTYADQAKYADDFVNGQRDGLGEIVDKNGTLVPGMRGVFIKNVLAPHGVVVEVTVVSKNNIPIQYGKVALNKYDSVQSHVDRIGTVMG